VKFQLIPPSIMSDNTVCKKLFVFDFKFFVTVHGLLDTKDLNTTLLRNVCDSLPVGTL
jgi:hypothetical protein